MDLIASAAIKASLSQAVASHYSAIVAAIPRVWLSRLDKAALQRVHLADEIRTDLG
ncbi:hypothetical protein [Rhizobium sp. N122]|uniref:hypothetical protein n=1 Tax=Rhizobium sp. N122 TaxID=1764272 RepID=UPI00167DD121|nr:hypothetical protein [Rhizobium sp. N122]